MPAGADRGFAFDPPGAIGLWFDDARVMLRLHDPDVTVPPKDEVGSLDDLTVPVGAVAPAVVDAVCGQGRSFRPSLLTALSAKDLSTGSSLVTRDCTVMAILSWDVAAQDVAAAPGTLICRGDSSAAAEFVAYELRLSVVSAGARTGSISWSWQDISGGVHAQTGAQFTCPTGFTLLTATRRWASPTEVVLRYYIGDALLGEVTSADGDIGGGVTGTFLLGANRANGVDLGGFFAGVVDELAVFDREMCFEEIEDTWRRITLYQPLGRQVFVEMHDPGFPMSRAPDSDVQLENRWIGQTLGFAASRFENIRRNLVPQRSYGQTLVDWETVLRPTTQPGQGFDERRNRVIARLQQRLGSSLPGLRNMLEHVINCDPSNLEFLAFSNTWVDGFDTVIDPVRWDTKGATWAISGGQARIALTSSAQHPWLTDQVYLRRSMDGEGRQAHQIAKLIFQTSFENSEAGIYFGDHGHGSYFLLGMRQTAAANYHIFTELFVGGISQGGAIDQGDAGIVSGGTNTPIWLYIHQAETFWEVTWSLTSGTAGFGPPIMVSGVAPAMQWAGMYTRTVGAVSGSATARFDDHTLRNPYGTAPLNAWVLLDEALGFRPDLPGSRQVVDTVRHCYVAGGFTTTRAVTYDDPDNGYGDAPFGGY